MDFIFRKRQARHKTIGQLFEVTPPQYGLRGDIPMWEELTEITKEMALPESAEELKEILHNLYEQVTGQPTIIQESFYLKKYAEGGMSSGHVSPKFWIERGFPLILERYKKAKSFWS